MQIFLIRHGEIQSGERRRYYGSTDLPLTPAGQNALLRQEWSPERVWCSPMRRAVQTAEILFPATQHLLIPDLREMDFGAFEGRGWWEMQEDEAYRAWTDSSCRTRCPGGEDWASFSARVCTAFDALIKDAFAEGLGTLAVVAHGGTQMAVLERFGASDLPWHSWQTACGEGWLLQAERWPGKLHTAERCRFTQ